MQPRNEDARCKAQGPQMNHTPTSVDFHLPTTPTNPQIKTCDPTEETCENRNTHSEPPAHMTTTPRCKTKCAVQTSTTHPLCGIQIKPPEMTTHPNGHPPICKTKYKAHNQGAKSVPHTHFGRLLPSVKTHLTSTQGSPQYAQPPKPKEPAPKMTIDKCVYHTPTSAGVPSPHENSPDEHMGKPPVCAATQAQRALPLNTGIDKIAYHTPAAAVCHLDPTPVTLPNKHGRMMTNPPNESRQWQ
ncbi:hypothetical protein BS47DRAFT_1365028 [Hydnum rufescens UP504]|uniref:Uncharacterized protein n=1 Tax=Hydnum rufescens UP504 TaxID=1448309 RepID=A0A9P6ARU8_9AGAM|nr:hypothetical protein BS47DRAFT_1365028 [Hydnum rufescens UP504]